MLRSYFGLIAARRVGILFGPNRNEDYLPGPARFRCISSEQTVNAGASTNVHNLQRLLWIVTG